MIHRKDLLAMSFYEKSPFTGSEGRMCYRVEKIMQEIPSSESEDASDNAGSDSSGEPKTQKMLQATVWPGPYCYTVTAEEKKIRQTAEFSDEGLEQLVDWMNQQAQNII